MAAVANPMYTRGGADAPEDRGGSMVRLPSPDPALPLHTTCAERGDVVPQLRGSYGNNSSQHV